MAAKLSGPKGGGKNYVVEQNADINVTPFVDVMLVLLIIFMVTIPRATVSIKIDMPPAPTTPPTDLHKPAVITVENDGNIDIAGAVDKRSSLEGLPADLDAALKAEYPDNPNPRTNAVFVRAQPDVQYEKFMDVLNKLQDFGYTKVGLVNEDIT